MLLWLAKCISGPRDVDNSDFAATSLEGLKDHLRMRPLSEWSIHQIEFNNTADNICRVWNRDMPADWARVNFRLKASEAGRLTKSSRDEDDLGCQKVDVPGEKTKESDDGEEAEAGRTESDGAAAQSAEAEDGHVGAAPDLEAARPAGAGGVAADAGPGEEIPRPAAGPPAGELVFRRKRHRGRH